MLFIVDNCPTIHFVDQLQYAKLENNTSADGITRVLIWPYSV